MEGTENLSTRNILKSNSKIYKLLYKYTHIYGFIFYAMNIIYPFMILLILLMIYTISIYDTLYSVLVVVCVTLIQPF